MCGSCGLRLLTEKRSCFALTTERRRHFVKKRRGRREIRPGVDVVPHTVADVDAAHQAARSKPSNAAAQGGVARLTRFDERVEQQRRADEEAGIERVVTARSLPMATIREPLRRTLVASSATSEGGP